MSEPNDASFLGRGWAFPVLAGGANAAAPTDVDMVHEAEDVRQAILIILETAKGERLMRPDFGCGLRRLVFEPLSSTTKTLVEREVEEALIAWEPRVELREVVATPDASRAVLSIDIRYVLRSTNTFYNLVYPFYLQELRA